ncbi:hypothetical protein tb265_16280 [Gemmatimonadetes bacterium T265]|nr:hypothetical protein tb265_16280 [Gemmatimonadetes bacterium T265]
MSFYSTASLAMEHDTARRLEALDPASHDRLARRLSDIRLDHGRMVRDYSLTTAAALANEAPSCGEDADEQVSGAPTPAPARPSDPAREALDRTCLTVKRIAADIGMPRATLEAYRLGTRRMPHPARVRLGTYLAAHAAMLDGLAQALIAPPTVDDQ